MDENVMCYCFCVLIYCVATRLLFSLLPRLIKWKSLITSRLLWFRVESGLTSKGAFFVSAVDCRVRAIRIYILRTFQHPNPCCPFWFLETINQELMLQAKTREISLPAGSLWSCTEVTPNIFTQVCSGPLQSYIDTQNVFPQLVIIWYTCSQMLKKMLHFEVCYKGKAGQGHRIESIAWYAQTIVYYISK